MVAPSIHPNGTAYTWRRTLRRLANLPEAPNWTERKEGVGKHYPLPADGLDMMEIQDALRSIPADDREVWLQVGMALHSTGHPAACGAWEAWSATSQKYDPASQEKTWRSFKGGGTTVATVYALAQQHGWMNPKSAAARQIQAGGYLPPPETIPMEAYQDVPAPKLKPAAVEKGKWRANLVSAADIVPTSIRWLWPGWIASGKLTVLAGAGGAGKTTLALGLIATLTSGGRWPDGTPCLSPRNVVIWSSEDDPADTLVPRLIASGADLRRVHFVRAITDENGERQPFDPATNMDLLRTEAAQVGNVGMLLLDPLVSAVKGDMHRANDVRRSLQAVVDFAEAHDCAVLGISHFAKGGAGTTPADRVVGSQAFAALARTVLVAAKQEDGESRVLARAKSNISADEGGVQYFITPKTVGDGIDTTAVEWGAGVDGSAREILGTVEEHGDEERTEQEDAERFLRDLLAAGPVPAKGVRAESSDAGYAWATIRRAQKTVGVEAYREGAGIGNKSAWFWRLPAPKVLTETLRCSHPGSEHLRQNVSTLGDSGSSAYADIRG